MKTSTLKALRTGVQAILGLCAAVPVFLATSGWPADVGAGATAVAVAAAIAKVMNTVDDVID